MVPTMAGCPPVGVFWTGRELQVGAHVQVREGERLLDQVPHCAPVRVRHRRERGAPTNGPIPVTVP